MVHESKEAGQFIPGHAKYPVEKLSEQKLRLLQSRSSVGEVSSPPPDITTPRAAATTQVDKSPATTVPGSPALGGEVAKAGVPREADKSPEEVDKSPEEEDSWPEDLYPFPEETPGGAVTAPASTPKGTTCDKGSHSHTRGKAYVGKISSCYDKYKDGSYWKILG